MKLPIATYYSDKFRWKNGRGSADASDFGSLASRGTCLLGDRLYDDAVDIGFFVESAKTGHIKLFTYVNNEDGYDGELQVYSSSDGVVITIFND